MKCQTLVIGLDGATFEVIQPLIEAEQLPNLARLKGEGTWGILHSVMPPESAPAWSSFLTGTKPGKHGVFGFTRRIAGSYEWQVNTSSSRFGPDLTDILSRQGKKAGLFNIPLTYPPHPTNGFIVSGMGTPGLDSDFVYPPELKTELLEEFGEEAWIEEEIGQKTPLEYLNALHRSIDRTLQISEFLLRRFPALDLYVIVFMAADRVQHFYWDYVVPEYPGYITDAPEELREAINGVYKHLDQAVGQLINSREDRNVVILSDHGGGPFYRMVNLNLWLEKEGYLKFLDTRSTIRQGSIKTQCLKSMYRFFQQNIVSKMSRQQREQLRRLVPQQALNHVQGYRQHPTLNRIDWSHTQAYAEGTYGRIFLNLAGREPSGIVPLESKEQILDEIRAKLVSLRDPETGETAVERVYLREELFQGPFADQAPDLFIIWRAWGYHVREHLTEAATVFSDPPSWQSSSLRHTGNHRPDGIVLLNGESINKGECIEGARIIDLAPTLLYLLETKIPKAMDGQVLIQAITSQAQASRSRSYEDPSRGEPHHGQQNYTAGEETAMKERLRELGYID
jgi:predicted AlkP superfamily phosphohydrolase/phosphomutase